MQSDLCKVLLEPIARSSPGADGLVDLYLLPAYDDIASLYYYDDKWHLHYMFPNAPIAGNIREAEGRELKEESLLSVLSKMKSNAE